MSRVTTVIFEREAVSVSGEWRLSTVESPSVFYCCALWGLCAFYWSRPCVPSQSGDLNERLPFSFSSVCLCLSLLSFILLLLSTNVVSHFFDAQFSISALRECVHAGDRWRGLRQGVGGLAGGGIQMAFTDGCSGLRRDYCVSLRPQEPYDTVAHLALLVALA